MRVEPCVCGGCITAPSLKEAAPHVEAHNATMLHRMWRAVVHVTRSREIDPELWRELQVEQVPTRPTTYRDPRRLTAVESPRDLSGFTDGTSTAGESW